MARSVAALPAGSRITDYISLGVLSSAIPRDRVDAVLAATGKKSLRQRDLPAHVVVYYVVALALFMQSSYREVLRCLLEGLDWLRGPAEVIHTAGKSGISQARTRLGSEPLRLLLHEIATPIGVKSTRSAWYRTWRLVSLDGSTLDVADTAENAQAFGLPSASRGSSAYPQLRFVSLLENGTHVLFGAKADGCDVSEMALAKDVVTRLKPEMLCLADRYFYSSELWSKAAATGAKLVWRVRKNMRLQCLERFADGSYRSAAYPTETDWRHKTNGIPLRVIDYQLKGVPGAEPIYRLVTNIMTPSEAPAEELAALYPGRWGIETVFDELKTHLRGARIVLRSKTPELVRQEFYGLLLAHFAIRSLMHQAALGSDIAPRELSFLHAVRVVRRKLPRWAAIPPSGQENTPSRNS